MKNLYKEETLAHKDDAIVQKYTKQIKINRALWIVGSALGLILTIVLAVIGSILNWQTNVRVISIVIPAVVTALAIVMTAFIWIGNEIGIKKYKTDKITFYSGPWTNALYVNDELIYRGSAEHKMVATLCDKSLCKINLKTLSFSINILPPGSDPITGLPKKEEPKTTQTVVTEQHK